MKVGKKFIYFEPVFIIFDNEINKLRDIPKDNYMHARAIASAHAIFFLYKYFFQALFSAIIISTSP